MLQYYLIPSLPTHTLSTAHFLKKELHQYIHISSTAGSVHGWLGANPTHSGWLLTLCSLWGELPAWASCPTGCHQAKQQQMGKGRNVLPACQEEAELLSLHTQQLDRASAQAAGGGMAWEGGGLSFLDTSIPSLWQ